MWCRFSFVTGFLNLFLFQLSFSSYEVSGRRTTRSSLRSSEPKILLFLPPILFPSLRFLRLSFCYAVQPCFILWCNFKGTVTLFCLNCDVFWLCHYSCLNSLRVAYVFFSSIYFYSFLYYLCFLFLFRSKLNSYKDHPYPIFYFFFSLFMYYPFFLKVYVSFIDELSFRLFSSHKVRYNYYYWFFCINRSRTVLFGVPNTLVCPSFCPPVNSLFLGRDLKGIVILVFFSQ